MFYQTFLKQDFPFDVNLLSLHFHLESIYSATKFIFYILVENTANVQKHIHLVCAL